VKSYQKRQKIKLFAGELSASKHIKFELKICQNVKIKEQIVCRIVSSEIDIYCNNFYNNFFDIPLVLIVMFWRIVQQGRLWILLRKDFLLNG